MRENSIDAIVRRIGPSARVTVLTGAGVSAASGVPTFRGKDGLWKSYAAERLATPEAFASDPRLVWEWYDWRRTLISRCRPNGAHRTLALWGRRYEGFRLITQNVDGLDEKAGSEGVIRSHGSIWEVFCLDGCARSPRRWVLDEAPLGHIPPSCPWCGGLVRPGVVWFGEGIDPEVLRRADAALDCDLFLAVGTSALVYPAAGLVDAARRRGAFTVEINREATPATGRVDLAVQGGAEEVLGLLERRLGGRE